jgi:hypothetical protein
MGRIWSTIFAAVVKPRAAQCRHSGSRFSVALRIACHRLLLYAGSTTLGGLYVVEVVCLGGSVPSLKGFSLFTFTSFNGPTGQVRRPTARPYGGYRGFFELRQVSRVNHNQQ